MSAETVVKKRGRPKKIVPETTEVELKAPEVKKVSSRAKSTTATPKPAKLKRKVAAAVKVPVVKKSTTKPAAIKKADVKPIETSSPPPNALSDSVKVEPHTTSPKVNITAETSKIIQAVREFEGMLAKDYPPSSIASQPSQARTDQIVAGGPKTISKAETPKPSIPQETKATTTPTSSKFPPPVSNPSPPPSNPTMPKPAPKINLAAFNSAVVSNISERAGARPNIARSKALPQNYNTVARKVTFAIVAMPITIVTSYVLYQRLVLGEDRKLLVPTTTDSDTPRVAVEISKGSE